MPHLSWVVWAGDLPACRGALRGRALAAALCAVLGAGGSAVVLAEELPLLGSSRGGHLWFDFCEGKPDAEVLPPDPRSFVRPGVSDGKAVHFNTWWNDCHVDPELVGEFPHPETCGELRESYARGETLMRGNGAVGAGNFFAGDSPGGYLAFPAESYAGMWRLWGLTERPDNYDHLAAERFGYPVATERNPYPIEGEDPNETDGGLGQLPISMTQIREADGTWTGQIGLTCHGCHSGQVGTPEEGEGLGALYGSGTGLHDVGLAARELALGTPPMIAFSLFASGRGTNNAQFANLVAFPGPSAEEFFGWVTSGSTASMDTPAWWNLGHRPVKFIDGSIASDAVRVDMAFYTPLLTRGSNGSDWVSRHAQDADHWVLATRAPKYPLGIEEPLAEQGAVVFHTKNLWAPELDNPVRKPEGGNGSCASCHGAYAPRYANDPGFLADPSMAGVAANVTPIDIIGTDPERLEAFNEAVLQSNGGGFAGYPETVGTEHDCGAQNRSDHPLRGDREPGYVAPPLYGVWATAPYFHNGSVPDVQGVLDPSSRPKMWRRWSTPARPDQEPFVVMGYDTSLSRAYDPERLGWKYDTITCGDLGALPVVDCDPLDPDQDPLFQQALAELYGNMILAWNLGQAPVLAQWTKPQMELRKIYNTHLFSQGNEGHEFTSVLTDAERRALIEYLKTL